MKCVRGGWCWLAPDGQVHQQINQSVNPVSQSTNQSSQSINQSIQSSQSINLCVCGGGGGQPEAWACSSPWDLCPPTPHPLFPAPTPSDLPYTDPAPPPAPDPAPPPPLTPAPAPPAGKDRAREAALKAIHSPLLDIGIDKATGVVWNITGPQDMTLFEVRV